MAFRQGHGDGALFLQGNLQLVQQHRAGNGHQRVHKSEVDGDDDPLQQRRPGEPRQMDVGVGIITDTQQRGGVQGQREQGRAQTEQQRRHHRPRHQVNLRRRADLEQQRKPQKVKQTDEVPGAPTERRLAPTPDESQPQQRDAIDDGDGPKAVAHRNQDAGNGRDRAQHHGDGQDGRQDAIAPIFDIFQIDLR